MTPTSQPVVFDAKPPNLSFYWMFYTVFSSCILLIGFTSKGDGGIMTAAGAIVCIGLGFLSVKHSVQVTVDMQEKILTHFYITSWGTAGSIRINIIAAKGNYRYLRSKTSKYWRLKLYNGNSFFAKKVALTDSSFSKQQLDAIEKLIDECKGISNNYNHHVPGNQTVCHTK